ncbi:MAG: serine/threonine protein kinase (plasmid) [Leptolyngbya sp. BL-A-14]
MSDFPDLTEYGYQVERELGHNRSNGRVTYLALEQSTQAVVVIKQFQFAQAGSTWSDYQQYEQEMKLLQRLKHPSIPRFLTSFETPTGFCLVQEYKPASSLAQRHVWTLVEVRQIAEALLNVLMYLQQQQPPILHRDIKPENILVERQNSLKVYLVDFGFARAGGGDLAVSSVVKGTLGFLPPEQLLHRELTKASDLYSLGVTLLCLLTGTRSRDVGQLINENYGINLATLPPQGRVLEPWLLAMTAPKAVERYADARSALQALRQVDLAATNSLWNALPVFSIQLPKRRPVILAAVLGTATALALATWNGPQQPQTPASRQAGYYELLHQGQRLMAASQYAQALDVFDLAVRLDPNRGDALYGKCAALAAVGYREAAFACLDC